MQMLLGTTSTSQSVHRDPCYFPHIYSGLVPGLHPIRGMRDSDSEVIDAHHQTMLEYDAARVMLARRTKAFTDLLVAERFVMSRLGIGAVPHLNHYRAGYYP